MITDEIRKSKIDIYDWYFWNHLLFHIIYNPNNHPSIHSINRINILPYTYRIICNL